VDPQLLKRGVFGIFPFDYDNFYLGGKLDQRHKAHAPCDPFATKWWTIEGQVGRGVKFAKYVCPAGGVFV
jgi:hypothetical protein